MKSLIAPGLALLLSFGTSIVAHAGAAPSNSSYSGIIGIGGEAGDQGKISITVTSTGNYTLKGKAAGIGFSHKGEIPESGTVVDDFVIKLLGGFIKVPTHLEFTVSPNGDQITGFASFEFRGDTATLNFTLYKSFPYTKASPAPQTGRHVILFTPAAGSPPIPGRGVATVKVSPTGFVKVVGTLSDGAQISCGGSLSGEGIFSILNVLYGRKGAVAGFAQFGAGGALNELNWLRVSTTGALVFNGKLTVSIHPYAPPAAGLPAISFGSQDNTAPLNLSGGGLLNFPAIPLQVTDANKVNVTGENENRLKLSLNKSTGLISGTILLEIGDVVRKRAVKLVILQEEGIAQGFFISPEPSANADLGFP
jgi:hypothetical protein